jgi:hypothetical protein
VLAPTGQTVYDVTFPVNPTPLEGQLGRYTVSVSTNLPDGTLTDLEYSDALAEGRECCVSVVQGAIQVPLVNNHCVDNGTLQGSDVTIQVIAAPNFAFMQHEPPGSWNEAPIQPDSVIAVLGTNFENLTGPDVQMDGDMHMLIGSQKYQLPPDTCVSGR